jgi:sugar lactone lactonase YvrE
MADFKTILFSKVQNQLGESPLWHPILDMLFWVDINKKLLFCRSFDEPEKIHSVEMPFIVTAIAWHDAEHLILGTELGIYRYNINSKFTELIIELESNELNRRSNDGRADPWGGFWLSTMDKSAQKGQGKVYRYYNKKLDCIITDLTIPNGLCFDKNRSRGYYCDSFTSCIYQLDLDDITGEVVGTAKVFYQFSNTDIDPDGCVIDSKGNLWLAVWGMGCIMCLSPDAELLHTIKVNTLNPTCTAFGGKQGELLFVTSALCESSNDLQNIQGATLQITGIKNGQLEPPVIL